VAVAPIKSLTGFFRGGLINPLVREAAVIWDSIERVVKIRVQLILEILPGEGLRTGPELRVFLGDSDRLTVGGGLALQALGRLAATQRHGHGAENN
jgi:hypothetical protein